MSVHKHKKRWHVPKDFDSQWESQSGPFHLVASWAGRRSWKWSIFVYDRYDKSKTVTLAKGSKKKAGEAMTAANFALVDLCDGALQYIPYNSLEN